MKFTAHQRVKVVNCPGSDLEGMIGTILGETFESYGHRHYFVLFDEKIDSDYPGLSLTQSILEAV